MGKYDRKFNVGGGPAMKDIEEELDKSLEQAPKDLTQPVHQMAAASYQPSASPITLPPSGKPDKLVQTKVRYEIWHRLRAIGEEKGMTLGQTITEAITSYIQANANIG